MNELSEPGIKSVSMKATAKKTEDSLVIDYSVSNLTEQDVYLWDLMVSYEGVDQKIDHDGAYVFFEEPDKLRVIRADLPLPTAFDIAKKDIPYARLLPARGSLAGRVKLRHPVMEESPYYGPPAENEQNKVKCSEVILYVGWTPFKNGINITERTVGGEKVYAIRGAWPPPYQEVLKERLPIDVEAIIYTGEFERQKPLQ